MVRAIVTDSNEVLPACSWVSGEYGINDVFLGVPTQFGKNGVSNIVELDLSEIEKNNLVAAADAVKIKVEELDSIINQ